VDKQNTVDFFFISLILPDHQTITYISLLPSISITTFNECTKRFHNINDKFKYVFC